MRGVTLANQRDSAISALSQEACLCRQIFEALENLAAGKFGTCLQCAELSSKARLRPVPWVSLCLRCQETADNARNTGKVCRSGATIEARPYTLKQSTSGSRLTTRAARDAGDIHMKMGH